MRPLLFLALLSLLSCKKSADTDVCQQLRAGVIADDRAQVAQVVGRVIQSLPDNQYNSANVSRLAEALSGSCGVTATLACFSCIQTLPEQSELRLELSSGNMVTQRVVDISFDADNRMVFVNMHN